MRVHNHRPYCPPCNERVIDGQLRGACLDDDGRERGGVAVANVCGITTAEAVEGARRFAAWLRDSWAWSVSDFAATSTHDEGPAQPSEDD